MQESGVGLLGQEDHVDKEMVTHSRILAWSIPWREEPSRLQSMGLQKNQDMTEGLSTQYFTLSPLHLFLAHIFFRTDLVGHTANVCFTS